MRHEGDEGGVGRAQGVEQQPVERGRGVDENEIVALGDGRGGQRAGERPFVARGAIMLKGGAPSSLGVRSC